MAACSVPAAGSCPGCSAIVTDLLATLRAEDAFDLTARLGSIETPTLVVGGERDAFYGADLFRETAHGLPRGQVLLYPGIGHGGT